MATLTRKGRQSILEIANQVLVTSTYERRIEAVCNILIVQAGIRAAYIVEPDIKDLVVKLRADYGPPFAKTGLYTWEDRVTIFYNTKFWTDTTIKKSLDTDIKNLAKFTGALCGVDADYRGDNVVTYQVLPYPNKDYIVIYQSRCIEFSPEQEIDAEKYLAKIRQVLDPLDISVRLSIDLELNHWDALKTMVDQDIAGFIRHRRALIETFRVYGYVKSADLLTAAKTDKKSVQLTLYDHGGFWAEALVAIEASGPVTDKIKAKARSNEAEHFK